MIKTYKLFFTPACPHCHEIKKFMITINLNGNFVDATTVDGEELTKKHNIFSVPTVIFLDENNDEVTRASTIEEIKRIIEHKTLS